MYACYIGHDSIVNLLLEAGVSVNIRNLKGESPLMLAASCGNESVGFYLCQVSEHWFLSLLKKSPLELLYFRQMVNFMVISKVM